MSIMLQVHMTDQVMLLPLWNSFVGTGIHNGPVPPALQIKRKVTGFTSVEKVHTQSLYV